MIMFSREDISRTKQEFWTAFGRYMSPVPSAEGEKISWINYHTGVKGVYFRLDAGVASASMYISVEPSNDAVRELYYKQFHQAKKILHAALGEAWDWHRNVSVDSKIVSRISKDLPDVSIMNKEHWPQIISFFKPRMIALDEFWSTAKYGFEDL
jgi:hypothetical protein